MIEAACIPCPMATAAVAHRDEAAVIHESTFSFAVFNGMIARYAAGLAALGVKQGDRVFLIAAPSSAYCAALWALFRLGAVACPLNPSLPKAQLDALVQRLRPACVLDEGAAPTALANSASLSNMFAAAPLEASEQGVVVHPRRPALIVMTSGSSGAPKAAALSLGNLLTAAQLANRNMPLAPGDCWLLSLPLHHVAGLAILFRCAIAGAAVGIPPPGSAILDACAATQATHLSLVPTQLKRLLDQTPPAAALSSLKGVLLGGAPLEETLIDRALAADLPLTCSYGMTETSAQLCATPPGASRAQLLSSGKPLAPETLRIAADGGVEVGGPTLFMGYVAEKDLELPLTADGWFRTGDLGRLDAEGFLHIQGRADAMFISGGENIHPEEIEQALLRLPTISRAMVVPAPHADFGVVPIAFVETEDQEAIDETLLRTILRQQLPPYKIPKRIFPWPEIEQESAAKANRQQFINTARLLYREQPAPRIWEQR